jgi:hypothetical protein
MAATHREVESTAAEPGKPATPVKQIPNAIPLRQTHLDRLGISALHIAPDSVCITAEGALWGSVQAHGLLRDMVIVNDDADPFAVGRHALCLGAAERAVHNIDAFTDLHRTAQERVRALIW